jgi:hypothetical protein
MAITKYHAITMLACIIIARSYLIAKAPEKRKRYTIMLSPSGDAHDTGRALSDGFERGITRQCAEKIKLALEEQFDTRVILSHSAGETISQKQKANFANRLHVDLYISLHACPSDHLGFDTYYYKSDLFIPTARPDLALYPTHQSSFIHHNKILNIAQKGFVDPQHKINYNATTPIGLPIKHLEGIVAPAFAIELHIQKTSDILFYAQSIARGIAHAINQE